MGSAPRPRRGVHRLFQAGILLKGFDGVVEVVGGLLFGLVREGTLQRWAAVLTSRELTLDTGHVIVHSIRHAAANMSTDTRTFASVYLVGHGLIKVLLAIGLLREKRWVYPTALAFLGAFVVYQVVRLLHTHSAGLMALTVFDVVIVALVWNEWRHLPREVARSARREK